MYFMKHDRPILETCSKTFLSKYILKFVLIHTTSYLKDLHTYKEICTSSLTSLLRNLVH